MEVPYTLNVDASNTIFMGSEVEDKGRLVIFKYKNDPLTENVSIVRVEENLGKVWNMCSVPKGKGTWIATGDGLKYFENDTSEGQFLSVSNTPKTVKCVELEYDTVFGMFDYTGKRSGASQRGVSRLWLGTANAGLLQLTVSRIIYRSGKIDSIRVDSARSYSKENGLQENDVNDLAIDRKNGYLWVATQGGGISRFTLGHSFVFRSTNAGVQVYPNPFIRSRHHSVIFSRCAPGSVISIYSLDGRLITRVINRENNATNTKYEWTLEWKPDASIKPGTYFYSARPGNQNEDNTGRRPKTTAGKILILP
jgi:ligand-binding sensor domain-containing protein